MPQAIRTIIIFCILLINFSAIFAAEEGSLTVKTTPEGIEVWIDEKYIGDSPVIDKKLKAGRYTVKLVDPIQHTSLIEEILIQDGKDIIVEKAMTGKFGSLKVGSSPDGAQVYILTSLGKTPVSNDFMNPGKYRIEMRHPNKRYAIMSEDIIIPKGETVSLEKTLEKASPFNMKALVRLGFGAGAIASFVWAIVEQGNVKEYETLSKPNINKELLTNPDLQGQYVKNETSARNKRTFGIILGCACVVGFEIVAFF
jgi:hypothetical protein